MRPSSTARRLAFIVIALLLGTVEAQAQSVTLAWDRNPEANIAGYTVYVGVNPGTYSSTNDVNGAANTTFTFSQAVPGQRYYFSVAAYNTENITGTRSNEVSWKINVGPDLTQPSNQVGAVGSPASLQLTATDDGDPLTYSATGLPAGVTINSSSGLISGTPTATGTFTVDATVSDGSLSASRTFTWTIGPRLTVTSLTSNVASPQVTGANIVFTAVTTGGITPHQYKFSVSSNSGSTWTVARNWATGATFTWTPTTASANYRVKVDARSAGVTADVAEGTSTVSYVINNGPLSVTSLTSNLPSPQLVNTAVTFTAAASGGISPYQFKFLQTVGTTTTVLRNWGTSASFTWTPTQGNSYTITVWARSAGATADVAEASRTVNFVITTPVTVGLTANVASPQTVGATITFTATPTGGLAPHQYKWWLWDGSTWTVARNWATGTTYTWTPTQPNPAYRVSVWVRNAGKTADVQDAFAYIDFPITSTTTAPATITSFTSSLSSPRQTGTAITFTTTVAGGVAPYQYKWWLWNGSTWTIVGDWNTANTFTWTPTQANPSYRMSVWVRSAGIVADRQETFAWLDFPITGGTLTTDMTAFTSSVSSPQGVGTAVTFSATVSGGTGPHQYKWWLWNGSTWTVVRDWTTGNTYTWTPTQANPSYRVSAWVRSAGVTADSPEDFMWLDFPVTAAAPADIVSFTSNVSSPQLAGVPVTLTTTVASGVAPYQYKWWLWNGSTWTVVLNWSAANTFTWTPTVANANYRISVWVRSAGVTTETQDDFAWLDFPIVP